MIFDFRWISVISLSDLLCSYSTPASVNCASRCGSVASRSIAYVGAASSPVRPAFSVAAFSASLHSAALLPDPIGPEYPLNRASHS